MALGWTAWLGLRRLGHEHDFVAEIAQALDQPGRGALAGDPVEVALAEVAEELAGGQQVEGGDEQQSTAAWLAGANPLPAFLEERCEREGSCWMSELYEAYTVWARESGITQVQQRSSVKRNLDNLGFAIKHSNRGLKVFGLRLRS